MSPCICIQTDSAVFAPVNSCWGSLDSQHWKKKKTYENFREVTNAFKCETVHEL